MSTARTTRSSPLSGRRSTGHAGEAGEGVGAREATLHDGSACGDDDNASASGHSRRECRTSSRGRPASSQDVDNEDEDGEDDDDEEEEQDGDAEEQDSVNTAEHQMVDVASPQDNTGATNAHPVLTPPVSRGASTEEHTREISGDGAGASALPDGDGDTGENGMSTESSADSAVGRARSHKRSRAPSEVSSPWSFANYQPFYHIYVLYIL